MIVDQKFTVELWNEVHKVKTLLSADRESKARCYYERMKAQTGQKLKLKKTTVVVLAAT